MGKGSIAATRARRGARWLDENFPDWDRRIDVDTLNLADGEFCICGQAFKRKAANRAKKVGLTGWEADGYNGYDYASEHLFVDANKWINGLVKMETKRQGLPEEAWEVRASRVATALGFFEGSVAYDAPGTDCIYVDYEDLQRAWTRLLKKRSSV